MSLESPIQFSVLEGHGQRLDAWLAGVFSDYSRAQIADWIQAGHVQVKGKACVPAYRLRPQDSITLALQLRDPLTFLPENIPLNIVFEDDHVLVINKPAAFVVHPGAGNWTGTLLNALLHHYPDSKHIPRAGIIHRLDQDTTGLLLIAKTEPVYLKLVEQLSSRQVKRNYCALVNGHPPSMGTVDAPIGRHPKVRTKMAVNPEGKPARTYFKVRETLPTATWLDLALETGRTHQIRVHLQHLGFPILGDSVYGVAHPALTRQALHARALSFKHPVTEEQIVCKAEIPEDFMRLYEALKLCSTD